MRITLHDNYSDKLIELCNSKGLTPCMYIKQLIAQNYEELNNNNPMIALDAQKVSNGKQRTIRQDI